MDKAGYRDSSDLWSRCFLDHLDAKIGHEKRAFQRFERTIEGIAALAVFCKHHAASLVVMEATGGYEKLAVGQLWAATIPVAIVNPAFGPPLCRRHGPD